MYTIYVRCYGYIICIDNGVYLMTLATTQFVNIVQNLGFPIAAFGLMWRFATVTLKENTRAIKDLCISLEGMKKK